MERLKLVASAADFFRHKAGLRTFALTERGRFARYTRYAAVVAA
jgi:hypothetical protein